MKITNVHVDESGDYCFTLENTDDSMANALRRTILNDVRSVAISQVEVREFNCSTR